MAHRIGAGDRLRFIPGIGIQVITPRAAAAREARIAAFRTKAKTGRITLDDVRDVLLALVGDRMMYIKEENGIEFLYLGLHTSANLLRMPLFY